MILSIGYILSQLLHVAISSAAGLAMLLLVTFFPALVRLGVSKAAAAMIGMSAFMDLGPAVGTANLAAKHAGMETAIYFAHYQLPIAAGVMLVVAVLIFFTARYFDAKDGHVVTQVQQQQLAQQANDAIFLPPVNKLVVSELMLLAKNLPGETGCLPGSNLFAPIVGTSLRFHDGTSALNESRGSVAQSMAKKQMLI